MSINKDDFIPLRKGDICLWKSGTTPGRREPYLVTGVTSSEVSYKLLPNGETYSGYARPSFFNLEDGSLVVKRLKIIPDIIKICL